MVKLWRKTKGYCWPTPKYRNWRAQHAIFEGKKAEPTSPRKSTLRTLKEVGQQYLSVFCDSLMRLSVGVAKALLDFSQFWIKNNYPLAVIVLPGLFERLSSLGWTRRTATVEKKTPARTM